MIVKAIGMAKVVLGKCVIKLENATIKLGIARKLMDESCSPWNFPKMAASISSIPRSFYYCVTVTFLLETRGGGEEGVSVTLSSFGQACDSSGGDVVCLSKLGNKRRCRFLWFL